MHFIDKIKNIQIVNYRLLNNIFNDICIDIILKPLIIIII